MSTTPAHNPGAGHIPNWTFGDKIRKARTQAGMEQRQFAAAINIKPGSLAAYETGRATPRFKDAPVIAKSIQLLTGIPYEWFLIEDEPNLPHPSNSRHRDYSFGGSSPKTLPDEHTAKVAHMADHRAAKARKIDSPSLLTSSLP